MLIALPAYAAADDKAPANLIDEALLLTDFQTDLPGLVEQIGGNLKELPAFQLLPLQEQQRMLAAMTRQFQPARIEAMVRNEIQAHLNASQVKAFLHAYRALMIERMRTLEQAADQPQAQTEQRQFQQQLATNPPASQRLAKLTRLDEATGGSSVTAEILTDLVRQLAQARGASGQDWEAFRTHLAHGLRADSVNTDLFVYRTVSDADLEGYVRLHETSEVRRFFQSMGQGISKAIATSLQNFLKELGGKLLEI